MADYFARTVKGIVFFMKKTFELIYLTHLLIPQRLKTVESDYFPIS